MSKTMFLSRQEAIKFFGEIDFEKKVWPNEVKWCSVFLLPETLPDLKLVNQSGNAIKRVYMNRLMWGPFLEALRNAQDSGVLHELKTLDGCLNVRSVRGGEGFSWHSYALAIDLNAAENPLGGPVAFSEKLIQCFTDAGFLAGAHFKRLDGMHFQWGQS